MVQKINSKILRRSGYFRVCFVREFYDGNSILKNTVTFDLGLIYIWSALCIDISSPSQPSIQNCGGNVD